MRPDVLSQPGLYLFRPPYREWDLQDSGWSPDPFGQTAMEPGAALVWLMAPVGDIYPQFDRVADRPRWLPLFVVLPEPEDVVPLAELLRSVPDLGPRGVLPSVGRGLGGAIRSLLRAPPRSLSMVVADQLEAAGVIEDEETRERVETIIGVAPHTPSIERLAHRLCQSRRTLGRHFHDRGLPVPSHWLQFARILHVAIQLQNTSTNMSRVAGRFGYRDGFTMSNSMKRLTGYRPSFVRDHFGWEWLVEAWLREEGVGGD